MSDDVTHLIPMTVHEAVNIEALLYAAALSFEHEADESARHGLYRNAATAHRMAAEARRLSGLMKAALDRSCRPGRAA